MDNKTINEQLRQAEFYLWLAERREDNSDMNGDTVRLLKAMEVQLFKLRHRAIVELQQRQRPRFERPIVELEVVRG